jgi:hypothetical protein
LRYLAASLSCENRHRQPMQLFATVIRLHSRGRSCTIKYTMSI